MSAATRRQVLWGASAAIAATALPGAAPAAPASKIRHLYEEWAMINDEPFASATHEEIAVIIDRHIELELTIVTTPVDTLDDILLKASVAQRQEEEGPLAAQERPGIAYVIDDLKRLRARFGGVV